MALSPLRLAARAAGAILLGSSLSAGIVVPVGAHAIAERTARIEQAVSDQRADQEVMGSMHMAQVVAHEGQAARARTEALDRLEETVKSAQQTAKKTGDMVMDAGTRVALDEAIKTAKEARSIAQADTAMAAIKKAEASLTKSHEEWKEEQAHIRAERKATEEAKRNAQQAARGTQPAPVSTKSAASKRPQKTQASAPNTGIRERGRAIVDRAGCSGTPIIWDPGYLPAGANGGVYFGRNEIALRSTMPAYRLEYVAAHECMHVRTARAAGGLSLTQLKAHLAPYFGTAASPSELAADCMVHHAGFQNLGTYTTSCGGPRGEAAKALLAGRLP